MRVEINRDFAIEIDKKEDCKLERPHCHIARNGKRVAKVWLDPIKIEFGHSLYKSESEIIYEKVKKCKTELLREYLNNKNYG